MGSSPPTGRRALRRFEHAPPNHLWQLDFHGHAPGPPAASTRWTLIFDHSRLSLSLFACADQQMATVQ